MSIYNERRAKMVSELQALKAENPEMKVFINKETGCYSGPYAVVSDGKDIIYVQFGEYGSAGYALAIEFVPNRSTGSGQMIYDPTQEGLPLHFTKELFDECVRVGHRIVNRYNPKPTFWHDFDAFINASGRRERYEELLV